MLNMRADAFAGTADVYLRYRPPYPKALLDDALAQASLPANATLLDLACGPGRVALAIAGSFVTVTAIDLEPEMIEAAKREAERRGIENVAWLVGRAEDLTLDASSIDLITIGEAFHRLDQSVIVERALQWLKPGGCIVTLGTDGLLAGRDAWRRTVARVAQEWHQRVSPAGPAPGRPGAEVGEGASERVIRRSGFTDVTSRDFQESREWPFEEIIGFLQSTSVCSRAALGEHYDAFEEDLRTALEREPGWPRFHEMLTSGYTIGRKAR